MKELKWKRESEVQRGKTALSRRSPRKLRETAVDGGRGVRSGGVCFSQVRNEGVFVS